MASVKVETLNNTNLVASCSIMRKKTSLLVDVRRSKTSFLKLPHANSGFANFIDEWSHCEFCFTNFGVILEYLESIASINYDNEKSHFQTFQHVVLACIHYREGYTK